MSAQQTSFLAPSRDPKVAALLGFVWPGVGYLYAGHGIRGVLLLLLLPVVESGILLLAVLIPMAVVCVAIPAAITLALHVLFARDAARAARGFPANRPVPRFSRWYSCLAAVVLGAGPNVLWVHAYRTTFVEAFKIPTGAMKPTILIGDHLLVVKWAYGWRDPVLGRLISEVNRPKRGELLVFRFPEDRSRAFIKRCIGLPGETVEVRGTAVLVGGRPLKESYVQFLEAPFASDLELEQADPGVSWGPQTVPADMYFVLGDNRDNSLDSRFWGFVPQEDLLGRAAVVYWSYEFTREEYRRIDALQWVHSTLTAFGRTRWSRVGHRLD